MRNGWNWIGWGVVVGLTSFPAWSAEPDPEQVRQRVEIYTRDLEAEEAAKPASAVDHDLISWQSAEKCGTAACFRAYLEDYPKGRYARMARARLEAESESRPAAAERPKLPSRPAQTLLADRYRDHGDGTVTDVKTGLQWMRCSLGQTWRGGTCVGATDTFRWQSALDAADALNRQGGYAGHRNWRLPTKAELQTLVYCSSGQPKTFNDTGKPCEGRYKSPTIYESVFPTGYSPVYWSSSVDAFDPDLAWYVIFQHGSVTAYSKSIDYAVRLVRGGQ